VQKAERACLNQIGLHVGGKPLVTRIGLALCAMVVTAGLITDGLITAARALILMAGPAPAGDSAQQRAAHGDAAKSIGIDYSQ